MKRISQLTKPLLVALVCAGCSGILTSENPQKRYYLLEPYTGAGPVEETATRPDLAVSVVAVPGLDTDRLLALSQDAQLSGYANARWPDNLPEVLTSVMRRSLKSSGRFRAVSASVVADPDDWLVLLELQRFYGIQAASGDTNSVQVQFEGKIQCGGRDRSFMLKADQRVGEQRLASIVAALQAALDDVTRELLGRFEDFCGHDDHSDE